VKAVKEDKTVGIMTDDDAFGWKKKKVQEIKEELKRLGLGAHGKKAELIARLEEHLSTERPSRAEPSNAESNNG
jgi:flavorubredoxin